MTELEDERSANRLTLGSDDHRTLTMDDGWWMSLVTAIIRISTSISILPVPVSVSVPVSVPSILLSFSVGWIGLGSI